MLKALALSIFGGNSYREGTISLTRRRSFGDFGSQASSIFNSEFALTFSNKSFLDIFIFLAEDRWITELLFKYTQIFFQNKNYGFEGLTVVHGYPSNIRHLNFQQLSCHLRSVDGWVGMFKTRRFKHR